MQKAAYIFISNTPTDYNLGRTLGIVDQVNKKNITYIFVSSGTSGDLDGSGRVKVVITGTDISAYVDQLITAINSANGHNAGVENSIIQVKNAGNGRAEMLL